MKTCCRTKIRNIEATEEAKQKLMAERLSRREKGVSAFVPTNVAVNFVQHNRCNGHVFHSTLIAIVKLCSHVSVS